MRYLVVKNRTGENDPDVVTGIEPVEAFSTIQAARDCYAEDDHGLLDGDHYYEPGNWPPIPISAPESAERR